MRIPPSIVSEDRFDAIAMEWRAVCDDLAQRHRERAERVSLEWDASLLGLVSEFQQLVGRGDWQRGPEDMFSILGVERNEMRHSAMLAWLLDPMARHGFGIAFLEAVIDRCFQVESPGIGFPVVVASEVARGDTRADIVVWGREFALIIENKVDAGEGSQQCDRIYHHFNEEPGALFLFVTPTGRSPKTATGEAASAFSTLSFPNVRSMLEDLIDERRIVDDAGTAIVHDYLRTLRREFP